MSRAAGPTGSFDGKTTAPVGSWRSVLVHLPTLSGTARGRGSVLHLASEPRCPGRGRHCNVTGNPKQISYRHECAQVCVCMCTGGSSWMDAGLYLASGFQVQRSAPLPGCPDAARMPGCVHVSMCASPATCFLSGSFRACVCQPALLCPRSAGEQSARTDAFCFS